MKERWLVTGATGLVGREVCTHAARSGAEVYRVSRRGGDGSIAVDLGARGAISSLLDAVQPDRIFHLAALASPAEVARNLDTARQVNVSGSLEVARWSARNERWLLFTSTDQVFDGEGGPYSERDLATPVTDYGRMKLEAEKLVLDVGGLVTRLGWVLGGALGVRSDFVQMSLARLKDGRTVDAVVDEERTPISVSDVAAIVCRLAAHGRRGLIHVAGVDHVTPYALVVKEAQKAGFSIDLVRPARRVDLAPAGRPRDLRLNTTCLQGLKLAAQEDSLARVL